MLWNEQTEDDDIIFGLRNLQTVTNSLSGSYIFNDKMGLNLRVRHYWSKVKYDRFFNLDVLGNLQDTYYTGFDEQGLSLHNTNFNAFNFELGFSWQIAPGSFLNIMWAGRTSY